MAQDCIRTRSPFATVVVSLENGDAVEVDGQQGEHPAHTNLGERQAQGLQKLADAWGHRPPGRQV